MTRTHARIHTGKVEHVHLCALCRHPNVHFRGSFTTSSGVRAAEEAYSAPPGAQDTL